MATLFGYAIGAAVSNYAPKLVDFVRGIVGNRLEKSVSASLITVASMDSSLAQTACSDSSDASPSLVPDDAEPSKSYAVIATGWYNRNSDVEEAVENALRFKELMKETDACLLVDNPNKVPLAQKANSRSISKELDELKLKSTDKDKVALYFSGDGEGDAVAMEFLDGKDHFSGRDLNEAISSIPHKILTVILRNEVNFGGIDLPLKIKNVLVLPFGDERPLREFLEYAKTLDIATSLKLVQDKYSDESKAPEAFYVNEKGNRAPLSQCSWYNKPL